MARLAKPFTLERRTGTKCYLFSLNPTCGLSERVCKEWKRKSFQNLPDELAGWRSPKNKTTAGQAVGALIDYLKQYGGTPADKDDETVGRWLKLFTEESTSPRAARLLVKGKPYSAQTLALYEEIYRVHLVGDPFMELSLSEVIEDDLLPFLSRLAGHKLKDDRLMRGTRTYEIVVKFVRMAFAEYHKEHPRWFNPFEGIDAPIVPKGHRDALEEDEVVKIFEPGILNGMMELSICAAMFLSGLRRGEIFALRPDDLDWKTPCIKVRRAWQCYGEKNQTMGPPKGKKPRDAPFDPVLQNAIKELWEKNGKYEYVFSLPGGTQPGQTWIQEKFKKWLKKANIDTTGRRISPHSSRHSLASMLEARGVSLRYIQELLGHSDLKTTVGYLHTPANEIRIIGEKIEGFLP
jgi:integrase/recombinase XerD